MPQQLTPGSYSRKDLIAAFRAESPDLADIDDNKIFAAIAVEDPELAKGISELRGELKEPILRDQAANYPSSQEQGQGGAGVQAPWYARFFPAMGEQFSNATSPIHSPLETATALKEGFPQLAKDAFDYAGGTGPQMARLARGETPADPLGMGAVVEPALRGDYAEAAGAATGMATGAAAIGAVAEPFAKVPAGRSNAAIRNAPRAAANKITTPEALELRAGANRAAAETASPMKGGWADDAISSGLGYAAAGPPGAAAAELMNLIRQTKTFKLGKANTQSRIAQWMAERPGSPVRVDIPEGAVANVPPTYPVRPKGMQQEFAVADSAVPDQYRPQFTEPAPATQPPESFLRVQRPGAQEIPDIPAASAAAGAPELNKWMGVSSKDVSHGANPGQRVLAENLLGSDKAATKANIDAALKSSGQALESQLKQSTKVIDANDIVIDSLSDVKGRYAPKDAAIQKNIDTIWEQIADDYPNLDKLSALEAQRLKSKLGDSIAWTGVDASSPFNQALIRIYRGINGKIKEAVPGAADELSRWGDLYVGSKSLKGSMDQNLVGRGTPSVFEQLKKK